MKCKLCGLALDTLDIGAYRKFADKSPSDYACRDCLAASLGWTRGYLDELILMYRRRGCLLFPPLERENEEKIPNENKNRRSI